MNSEYVTLLSAALTPIVGVLTVYIAWQQWRTNHLKVKHDLYDRRLAVYAALIDFMSTIVREARATDAEAAVFVRKTRESYFLFGEDIGNYLDTVYKRWVDLRCQTSMLDSGSSGSPGGTDTGHLAHQSAATLKWFADQCDVARHKFSNYMGLS